MRKVRWGLSFGFIFLLTACNISTPESTERPDIAASSWELVGTHPIDFNTNRGAGNPSLALDSSGNPVVGWEEYDGTNPNVYVKRWNGSSWVQLGDALDINPSEHAFNPSLALDNSGNPVVSWQEEDNISYSIYVKRWNGSSWVQLGNALNFNGNSAFNPSLALDSSGNPVVSWEESYNIYVQRWNGSSWISLGDTLDLHRRQMAFKPNLALDSSGNPIVSWFESSNIYVKRWNGSSWVRVGTSANSNPSTWTFFNRSLALNSSGNRGISWEEYDGTSTNIHVKRWNGASWVSVGNIVDANTNRNATNSSLALDNAGNPVVSWSEHDGTSNNIYVKRWNGANWVQLGTFLDANTNRDADSPSLALDNLGNPVVSWHEYDGTSSNIYVKRFIQGGQPSGNTLDTVQTHYASTPSITRKSNDSPIVAWQEQTSTHNNIYVKEWNGTSWTPVGSALDRNIANSCIAPSIGMRSDNRPVVAWQEGTTIYVKRWSGTSWLNVGGALDIIAANKAYVPSLVVDTSATGASNPVVAWYEKNGTSFDIYVKRWNGSTWVQYGTGGALDTVLSNDALYPSLALSATGNPTVAWYEDVDPSTTVTNYNVYVKTWNSTTNTWDTVGSVIDRDAALNALNPSLSLRTDGKPIVAWQENNNIYVKRWTGTSWSSFGTAPLDQLASNEAINPTLDIGSDNIPVVSWQEFNGSSYDVYTKRLTGSTWSLIGSGALDTILSNNAKNPSLVLKSDNNPIVAWDEWVETSDDVFVKQY